MTLFKQRGWTVIISDNLVGRMLMIVCLAIGLASALINVIVGFLAEDGDLLLVPWLALPAM